MSEYWTEPKRFLSSLTMSNKAHVYASWIILRFSLKYVCVFGHVSIHPGPTRTEADVGDSQFELLLVDPLNYRAPAVKCALSNGKGWSPLLALALVLLLARSFMPCIVRVARSDDALPFKWAPITIFFQTQFVGRKTLLPLDATERLFIGYHWKVHFQIIWFFSIWGTPTYL